MVNDQRLRKERNARDVKRLILNDTYFLARNAQKVSAFFAQ